ncbi:terpene synthase family protein [Chryseobacterium sp. MIQD13]|uniref:terpene synthase family protein n=1 Tax=Chryseobacterium sp. MIQD13 TaxID=3422310 RepID=UPI003D28271F
MSWATKIGKFKTEDNAIHTIGCDLVYWTALCFPLTKDREKYVYLSNYFQLYCILDDQSDEPWGEGKGDPETIQKYWDKVISLIETLRDETPLPKRLLRNIALYTSAHSYQRLIFNHMKKILRSGTPSFRKRYIDRFIEYIENAATQGHMRGNEQNLTVEIYKQYRITCIACITSLLMAEYLYEINLTDEEYHHPIIEKLEKTCTWQVTLTNDLFSLYKECKEGKLEKVNNIIPILVSSGMTLQEAVDETCTQIETAHHEFIKIRNEWYNSGEQISNDVRIFVTAMEYFMSGNTQWHRMSKRYHGKNFEDIVTSGYLEWNTNGTIYTKDFEQINDPKYIQF